MLRFSRLTTRQAWAAAMFTLAHRGKLPQRPANALAAAEHELSDADTADWRQLWDHAGQLVEQADEDLDTIVALIHTTVTKPLHEITCATCDRAFIPIGAGRPALHCG